MFLFDKSHNISFQCYLKKCKVYQYLLELGIYLHSMLDNAMIYSSSLNKDQHNLDHYILGDLLSDTSCILWNFYG